MPEISERPEAQGLTIDDVSTRDMDDAIWLVDEGDRQRLSVSIADVAHAIARDGELDRAARRRVYTRYHSAGNDPMLPRELADDRLSLVAGQPRATWTIDLTFSRALTVEAVDIRPTRLTSAARLSYDQVDRAVRGRTQGPHVGVLVALDALAARLLVARRRAGALAIYDVDAGYRTAETGLLVPLESAHRARVIVQECMIAANAAVAAWAATRVVPILYRNHRARPEVGERAELLASIDEALAGRDPEVLEVLRAKLVAGLDRARYAPEPTGHFALSLAAYTHVTSPIRRYPDLVSWRQIGAAVRGEPLPYTAEDLAQIAREVGTVEDSLRDAKAASFKRTANTLAERRGEREDALAPLGAAEFYRVVKVCAREGKLGPAVAAEFARRLEQGTVGGREAYAVLFAAAAVGIPDHAGALAAMRRTAGLWLVAHPEHAVTLASLGFQDDTFGEISYVDDFDGPTHRRRFRATATMSAKGAGAEPATSRVSSAATKKLARQLAVLDLLVRLAGLDLEVEIDTMPGGGPAIGGDREREPAAPRIKPAKVVAGDYWGALIGFAAANGFERPEEAFEASGPSHKPEIRCRVTFLGESAEATAPSNAKAKRAAARELYERVAVPMANGG